MKNMKIKQLTTSAMLFAVGLVLPFLTGQIPQIGSMLLPLHIPVFLCGLICGWRYGLFVGFVLPVFRSLLFGMPPLYPTAVAMAFELATYGAVAGAIYFRQGYFCIRSLLVSMVLAMVAGRVVWGAAMLLLMGVNGESFAFAAFISGALLNAIPGIILQFVLIPSLMLALHKTALLPHKEDSHSN